MRIYLPATRSDLDSDTLSSDRAHAVTAQLRRALPDDDEEMLELVAFLAAADDSVRLIAQRDDDPARYVFAADVPESQVAAARDDEIETVVALSAPVAWSSVVAIHTDEEQAALDVHAAAQGDDEAFERLGERELLWFDVTERDALRARD